MAIISPNSLAASGPANLEKAPLPVGPAIAAARAGRLASLDVYRGLVIVVLTLVNYLSPVQGVPAWSKHWPESLDGFTYVDVVFPAFLFTACGC